MLIVLTANLIGQDILNNDIVFYVLKNNAITYTLHILQLIIDHILSLISVRSNNYLIEGFDLTEINDMISHLTTN